MNTLTPIERAVLDFHFCEKILEKHWVMLESNWRKLDFPRSTFSLLPQLYLFSERSEFLPPAFSFLKILYHQTWVKNQKHFLECERKNEVVLFGHSAKMVRLWKDLGVRQTAHWSWRKEKEPPLPRLNSHKLTSFLAKQVVVTTFEGREIALLSPTADLIQTILSGAIGFHTGQRDVSWIVDSIRLARDHYDEIDWDTIRWSQKSCYRPAWDLAAAILAPMIPITLAPLISVTKSFKTLTQIILELRMPKPMRDSDVGLHA